MEDNEIQFLGYVDPYLCSSNAATTGIVLSVVEGDEECTELRFLKSRASEITIGRASSSPRKVGSEGKNAFFRCPVISRTHAKITFEESGHVTITDLGSHHGTLIRPRGQASFQPLQSGSSTQLNDGDLITFGKKVAKDDDWVLPVTVSIRFVNDNDPATPDTPSENKFKSHPGRFGCSDLLSLSSSDSSPNPSIIDVDEAPEELPILRSTPPQTLRPLEPLPEQLLPQQLPPIRGLSLLSRMISTANNRSVSPSLNPWAMFSASPVSPPRPSFTFDEPFVVGAYPNSDEDDESSSLESDSPRSLKFNLYEDAPHSPSPRPTEPMGNDGGKQAFVANGEEAMDMDSDYEEHAPSSMIDIPIQVAEVVSEAGQTNEASSSTADLKATDGEHHDNVDMASVVDTTAGDIYVRAFDARVSALDEALVNLRANVLRDHIASRKTQAEHQAQTEQLTALSSRTDEAVALLTTLRRRIDEDSAGLHDELTEELASVRSRLAAFEETTNEHIAKVEYQIAVEKDERMAVGNSAIEQAVSNSPSLKHYLSTLDGLVEDIRQIRDGMAASLSEQHAELAKLRSLREEAISATAAATAAAAAAATPTILTVETPTLKRKRDVIEEKEEPDGLVTPGQREAKRSRGRHAASVLGRTAAVAAVGAVAAWSALAFA